MPSHMPRTRTPRPIQYRDRDKRIWNVSEVAVLKVVSPAIDGPNLCLVIRFEREDEERFAHWIGGEDWRASQAAGSAVHRVRVCRVGRATTATDADTA